ncbi:hypothetical protein HanXRQr2_Chr04g0186071 [Helianthus annuus]|uniref:Uncharacterized protein n=1 Tax=Helianthus annuus TaxID=4232 RepID=A0A251V4L2_HELAN|nr:hypothetical protein HanXRQr2_Chr04g0186071 [Helianthus annuus]
MLVHLYGFLITSHLPARCGGSGDYNRILVYRLFISRIVIYCIVRKLVLLFVICWHSFFC